mmetsp:Transcript_140094/g.435712  ORF Transcript_140094/g.435712 Transcript_140094/m.435712 type:complete len:253 (-) Transcript_140094:7-765(-)
MEPPKAGRHLRDHASGTCPLKPGDELHLIPPEHRVVADRGHDAPGIVEPEAVEALLLEAEHLVARRAAADDRLAATHLHPLRPLDLHPRVLAAVLLNLPEQLPQPQIWQPGGVREHPDTVGRGDLHGGAARGSWQPLLRELDPGIALDMVEVPGDPHTPVQGAEDGGLHGGAVAEDDARVDDLVGATPAGLARGHRAVDEPGCQASLEIALDDPQGRLDLCHLPSHPRGLPEAGVLERLPEPRKLSPGAILV